MKKSILVVEDDPLELELTLAGLGAFCSDIDIASVSDGAEAIEYLFARAEAGGSLADTSLVIMDINMPRLDGISAVKALRSDHRTALMPIVMLSNSDDPRDVKAAYEAGANAFLRKPGLGMSSAELFGNMVPFWTRFNQIAA
ncbi:MAG TPA: response regulator [Usitatibacteraceae bacterium]